MKIGTYVLGTHQVDVYGQPGLSAEFDMTPPMGQRPYIRVGLDSDSIEGVWALATHEALEALLALTFCRYQQSLRALVAPSDGFFFLLDHRQFSEVAGWLAAFQCAVAKDLTRTWKRWQKKGKR